MKNMIYSRKGIILITSYLMIGVLIVVGISFLSQGIWEYKDAQRYIDRVKAFWIAEAGVSDALYNYQNDSDYSPSGSEIGFGEAGKGYYIINEDDVSGVGKYITVTGKIKTGDKVTAQRHIRFFLPYVADEYSNAISASEHLRRFALSAGFHVYNGDIVLGNTAQRWFIIWWNSSSWITLHNADLNENVNPVPGLAYPDMDNNGIPDEFNDFKLFNQSLISTYNPDEVVYIQTNQDVQIWPGKDGEGAIFVGGKRLRDGEDNPITLSGKKIVYVEGNEGEGDIEVYFGAAEVFNEGEDLTLITTGNTTVIEPLQTTSNSYLNIISWDDYTELNVIITNHNTTVFSHDDINLISILNYNNTNGVFIANNNIYYYAFLAARRIYYLDRSEQGLPPGFEGLIGSPPYTLCTTPQNWQELEQLES